MQASALAVNGDEAVLAAIAASSAPLRGLPACSAGFAEHDEKFGAAAEAMIRRDGARALGAGPWRFSLNWLALIELPDRRAAVSRRGARGAQATQERGQRHAAARCQRARTPPGELLARPAASVTQGLT